MKSTPRPSPTPQPERQVRVKLHFLDLSFFEPVVVNVASVINGAEHRVEVKGTVHTPPSLSKWGHGKEFDNFALLKEYLLEHACQAAAEEDDEHAIVFKSSDDAKAANVEILLGKGRLSDAARLKIEVTYLLMPTSRGQAYLRNATIDCP